MHETFPFTNDKARIPMPDLTQVNISVDEETLKMLEKMAREDGYENRSAFIRRLIRLEYRRREGEHFELTSTGQMQLDLHKEKLAGS
jgi:metal-responsive CopG/Arc/MetJ family transcriptional regulator